MKQIKKSKLMMILALVVMMTSVWLPMSQQPEPVNASVRQHHIIKWHHHRYRSKYTIKQMRRKYHLKYHKEDFPAHVNKFVGVTNSAASGFFSANPADRKEVKYKQYRGHFAQFETYYGGIGHRYHFVNLKTGHMHKYNFDEYFE